MYQAGEKIVYGIHGVCDVINQEERLIDHKRVSYLVLEPVGQPGSRYYVPTHNAAAMAKIQHIITEAELDELLDSQTVRTDGWVADENQRKQLYRELISSGNRAKLLQMIRTLYRHRKNQSAAGKKCHLCDENFLRDAEKILIGEISLVMHMEPEQAKKYLQEKLKENT